MSDLASSINNLYAWMTAKKSRIKLYFCILQAFAGVVLLLLGYVMGREHFRLIQHGERTQGTIIGYKQVSMPDRNGTNWDTATMPVVNFQAGGRTVQFRDWMDSGERLANVPVTVLYDPANPASAMIDRPVWNWIPWGPIFAVGVFLALVAIKGWVSSRITSE